MQQQQQYSAVVQQQQQSAVVEQPQQPAVVQQPAVMQQQPAIVQHQQPAVGPQPAVVMTPPAFAFGGDDDIIMISDTHITIPSNQGQGKPQPQTKPTTHQQQVSTNIICTRTKLKNCSSLQKLHNHSKKTKHNLKMFPICSIFSPHSYVCSSFF